MYVSFVVSLCLVRDANTLLQDRYHVFSVMARKWRHERMVKRAGRAFDPREDRVEATGPGELAVICRACPVPGWNLPEDWEQAPPERA